MEPTKFWIISKCTLSTPIKVKKCLLLIRQNCHLSIYFYTISPGAYSGGATYSFTADFRPQNSTQNNVPLIEPMKFSPPSPQKQYFQTNLTYAPQKSPNYGQVSVSKKKNQN
jgi:hypothetical protein